MRKCVGLVAAVTLAGLLHGSEPSGVKQGKSDRDKLLGTWVITSMEVGGKQFPVEIFKDLRFTFTAEKVAIEFGGQKKAGTYFLDTTKNPRNITLVPSPDEKDQKTMKGIYVFEDDNTVKICGSDGGDAPREFKTGMDAKTALIILKREKK